MNEEHHEIAARSTWRYLKAAFWFGVDAPALGRIPANLLAVIGFGILGLGEHALWLVGLGIESSFLFAMTFNRRFQRSVDANLLQHSEVSAEQKRRELVERLPQESRRRLTELATNCARALDIDRQNDDLVIDTNRAALARLEWAYVKLLVARHNLIETGSTEPEGELAKKVADLEAALQQGKDSEVLRQSKAATLGILKERLANVERRKESLEEVDSDLARIEAQVQLIIENASIQGKSHTVSAEIDLASHLYTENLFGDSSMAIADLDREYGGGVRGRARNRV